jgi:hypothetical protein
LLPGQAVHDHVILLPGIFLLVHDWRKTSLNWIQRFLLATAIAVVLWPWAAAFALVILRPLLSPETFYSKAVFALPLRTTAALPFVVLGLLALKTRHEERGGSAAPFVQT